VPFIPFNDLKPVNQSLAEVIRVAIERVAARGWFVLGPEVEAFEAAFAAYHGVTQAVGVANGTDAIELALRAAGLGTGDEVITVAHTAVATVSAIERTGAHPVLVDIDRSTFTIDPSAAAAAISPRTKALVPVHLYGYPCAMEPLLALAQRHHLFLLEDCAQAHGARWRGARVGTIGHAGAFSFYPTKNLGAWGDGGAVVTNDPVLAQRLRRLRNYGQTNRYHHAERGLNSRLDEVQAAILSTKLAHLDAHNRQRQELAATYRRHLHGVRCPPEAREGIDPVYHLFVVRHPQRDCLSSALTRAGVGTLIHYPTPVHLQPAYAYLGHAPGSLPQTEQAARQVLSLPLYVGLTSAAVAAIAAAVARAAAEGQP
jgi:dTDP-4-amino-4,6-dideoxygalactose transaminase